MKQTISITILITSILLILSFSMNKHVPPNQVAIHQKIPTDTIFLSDSAYQVFYWKEDKLESIRLFVNRKNEYGEHVVGQTVSFHSNGVINSIRMTNGVKSKSVKDYSVNTYQINKISFSDNGELQSSEFMKNFKVISSYPNKKTR